MLHNNEVIVSSFRGELLNGFCMHYYLPLPFHTLSSLLCFVLNEENKIKILKNIWKTIDIKEMQKCFPHIRLSRDNFKCRNYLSGKKIKIVLRRPGIEPGSQEWESCMIPLHQRRYGILPYNSWKQQTLENGLVFSSSPPRWTFSCRHRSS